jgi:hypothetical protein
VPNQRGPSAPPRSRPSWSRGHWGRLHRLGHLPSPRSRRFAKDGAGLRPCRRPVLELLLPRRAAHEHQRQDPTRDGREPDCLARHQLVVHGGAIDGGYGTTGGRSVPGAVCREAARGRSGEARTGLTLQLQS